MPVIIYNIKNEILFPVKYNHVISLNENILFTDLIIQVNLRLFVPLPGDIALLIMLVC